MTLSISDTIRKYLGWCPQAAAGQNSRQERRRTAGQPDLAGNAGPVAGRAALYSHLTWFIVGLSYVIALAALPFLPATIAVHWNLYGEPDGFSGGIFRAFGLPVIITLTVIFLSVLPRFERMKEPFSDSRDIYRIVVFSTVCMLTGVEVVSLLSACGVNVPVGVVFPMLFGLFLIVLGSLMPHVRRNTTIGFRLPWTIRDDAVWTKTHEHGGPVFMIAGMLIVLGSPFAGSLALLLMLGAVVAATLYIAAYSYRLAKTRPVGEGGLCSSGSGRS